MDLVESWAQGAQTLALLHTSVRSGLLDRMPLSPAEPLVEEVCKTLALAGVLACVDGRYELTPGFAAALDPAGMMPLAGVLEGLAARVQALQESQGYAEAAMGVALGATFNPNSPITAAALGGWTSAFAPELGAAWSSGGRHLELGCGVGGGLGYILLAYPGVTAVGVERDLEVAETARSLALRLGLEERLEILCQDAATFAGEGFDTGFWSQSFFGEESRAAALEALARAVKPGGLVLVPGFEGGEPAETLGYRLSRLVWRTWGVPARSQEELTAELSSAGFEVVRGGPLGPGQVCLLVRRL